MRDGAETKRHRKISLELVEVSMAIQKFLQVQPWLCLRGACKQPYPAAVLFFPTGPSSFGSVQLLQEEETPIPISKDTRLLYGVNYSLCAPKVSTYVW